MDLHKPLLPCSQKVSWLRKGGQEGKSIICIRGTKPRTLHPLLYSNPPGLDSQASI